MHDEGYGFDCAPQLRTGPKVDALHEKAMAIVIPSEQFQCKYSCCYINHPIRWRATGNFNENLIFWKRIQNSNVRTVRRVYGVCVDEQRVTSNAHDIPKLKQQQNGTSYSLCLFCNLRTWKQMANSSNTHRENKECEYCAEIAEATKRNRKFSNRYVEQSKFEIICVGGEGRQCECTHSKQKSHKAHTRWQSDTRNRHIELWQSMYQQQQQQQQWRENEIKFNK